MTIRVSTLGSGLRVATDYIPTVESATVGVWCDVGTRDEPAAVNGVAHLLEHMVFKGTRRRSATAIAEEIEAVGGHMNAYTAREQTAYYARVLKDDVELAVDMIADILQHSLFDPAELKRERAGREDAAFHRAISAASKNLKLEDAVGALTSHIFRWAEVGRRHEVLTLAERREIIAVEHGDILAAIAAGKAADARNALRRHLLNGRARLLSSVSR